MKYITTTVIALALFAVSLTLFVWWDTTPAKPLTPKYGLRTGPDLGLIVYQPLEAQPAIWRFECVGSTKDCGPSVVHSVPEPSTLLLLGLGAAGLFFTRRIK